MMQVNQLHLYR